MPKSKISLSKILLMKGNLSCKLEEKYLFYSEDIPTQLPYAY